MPMPFLFISSSRLDKRLDRFESTLEACHDRLNALSDVYQKLGYINTNLLRIYERLNTMQRAWDDLVAEVAALKDLDESVKAGFAALEQKLADALNNLSGAPTVAEIDALKAEISGAVADVKAAIPV